MTNKKYLRCSDECKYSKPPIDKECIEFENSKMYLKMKKNRKIVQSGILVKMGNSKPKLCFYDSGKFGWCNVSKTNTLMIKIHKKKDAYKLVSF